MIWNELDGLKQKEVLHICEDQGIVDTQIIQKLKSIKRFRDLKNEIMLYREINNQSISA